jgi:hypothetical protein
MILEVPSAMSCMRVCATLGLTLSPASSKTRTAVRTYQLVDGANLSAHCKAVWENRVEARGEDRRKESQEEGIVEITTKRQVSCYKLYGYGHIYVVLTA